ncbi:MAG: ABC transporter ATP-binding protein [Promethearchaeota archaeon]
MKVIQATKIRKTYHRPSESLEVLSGINLQVTKGEIVLITGRSGAGKTTLLKIIGCMELPTSGTLKILDTDTTQLTLEELTQLRAKYFGFIFQSFNLLPALTVTENIELPLAIRGTSRAQRKKAAEQVLGQFELGYLAQRLPEELSTGQIQRVAVMRALITEAPILIADEPTANLDKENTVSLFALLQEVNANRQSTIVICSQKNLAREYADAVYRMEGGRLKPV